MDPNPELFIGIIVAIGLPMAIALMVYGIVSLDDAKKEKKKKNAPVINQNHVWRSMRLLDAISAGTSVEYVDVTKNNIILKTPDGLVEAKVNQDNLPRFIVELKLSKKALYRHTNLWLNMDMDSKTAVIDICQYQLY